MQMRPLGSSGINASVVALGTWVMGGWMWGGHRKADSIAAIHASLDAGINFLDTAPIYGFGLSEAIVGEALQGRRDQAIIATKCGMVTDPSLGEFKFRSHAAGRSDLGLIDVHVCNRPDSIRREVETSLQRLRTDSIDLYQTHWQDSTTPIEDTMAVLTDLKQQGKIRAIGVCNATVPQMQEYAKLGPLDSDQEQYSMLDRDLEGKQLPYCQKQNIAVLAYSPLARGLLTGKMSPEREFEEGDVRGDDPRFSRENRRAVSRLLEHLQPVASGHHVSLPQLVLAWTFHQPGLTHVLAGARNPRQAVENAAAGEVSLSAEDLAEIRTALDRFSQELA